ncbi:MAG: GNAT family N-acetyltransferase [Chloroflexota bacterium]
MFKIRGFNSTAEEYRRIVEINNALWPDELNTVENLKYEDKTRDVKRFFQRFVIELDESSLPTELRGEIIGEAWCGQMEYESDPGRYFVEFHVDPQYAVLEYGDDGIAQAAMTTLSQSLMNQNPRPTRLVTYWREDKTERLDFLKAQGYVQEMRYQDSELDVTTFEPLPFAGKQHQVKSLGIEILSISQLKERFDDWIERIYEMDMEILPDEPSTGEFTPEPIEEYAKMFDHPSFLPEGWLIAVDGDTCVGSSSIWDNKADPTRLNTNFTGVRRSYRRKGITTALKLGIIEYARQRGATYLITGNEENNPMYQINVQLGFKPKPGWLEFHKKVENEQTSV